MTKQEVVLARSLEGLQGDVELVEADVRVGRRPDCSVMGTLRVNLTVARKNLNVATSAQRDLFCLLEARATLMGA